MVNGNGVAIRLDFDATLMYLSDGSKGNLIDRTSARYEEVEPRHT